MTRKVFVPLHAALAESFVSGEVCFLPDAAAFLKVAVSRSKPPAPPPLAAGDGLEVPLCLPLPKPPLAAPGAGDGLGSRSCLLLSKPPEPSRAKDMLISRAPSTEPISLVSSSVLSRARGRTAAGPGCGRCGMRRPRCLLPDMLLRTSEK